MLGPRSPYDRGTWIVLDGTGLYGGMSGQAVVSGTYSGGPCYPNYTGVVDHYTGTLRLAAG